MATDQKSPLDLAKYGTEMAHLFSRMEALVRSSQEMIKRVTHTFLILGFCCALSDSGT